MRKERYLRDRRDSLSSSSSADDGLIERIRNMHNRKPVRPPSPALFEGSKQPRRMMFRPGASGITAMQTASQPKDKASVATSDAQVTKLVLEDKYDSNAERSSMSDDLIPLDLEVDEKTLPMQCDRLSDGSDLSPEELLPDSSLQLEMLQASDTQSLATKQ